MQKLVLYGQRMSTKIFGGERYLVDQCSRFERYESVLPAAGGTYRVVSSYRHPVSDAEYASVSLTAFVPSTEEAERFLEAHRQPDA